MKFKIGDKVKVIKDVDEHKTGDIHIISEFRPNSVLYDYGFLGAGYIKECNIEFAESKFTKKERIKSLEENSAKQAEGIKELKLLLLNIRDILNEGLK